MKRPIPPITSILRFGFGFLVVAFFAVLFFPIALVLLPWRVARIKLCNLYGKITGRTICWITGAKPIVHGREILTAQPAIFVANHTSTLDAFIGTWLCPYGGCGVFKKEIARIPAFGQLLMLSGHLMIDRQNQRKAVDTLRDIAQFVKGRGLSIWIMPEGTRSKDGRLLPFKKGFVHLAVATGLPVVPVVLHGAHKNWEKHTIRFHPMDVHVDVLPAIDTKGWTEENAADHAQYVHDMIVKVLKDDQKPLAVTAPASETTNAEPALAH